MTYDEALGFFGSGRSIGLALRVSSSRVSQCRAAGGFSYPMQCVLEKESGGKLSAKREDDPVNGPSKTLTPALTASTDHKTKQNITRGDSHPSDWHLIRPELPAETASDPPTKKAAA